MKYTSFFKCVECSHILTTSSLLYKSPCPMCGAFMVLDTVVIHFEDRKEDSSGIEVKVKLK